MKELVRAARAGKLVCVVGPTASGKTELAVRVAEEIGGEIVSADSVQVYRHFELGTGKPTAEERRRARHHLVDVAEPAEPMDAARWAAMADAAIADARARGAVPIVCGGTFLWVKALLSGLADAPSDPKVRAAHRALVEAEGRAALHARLAAADPAIAARLHPNDVVRVSRALEVFELTGEKMSDVQARHGFRGARHEAALFAIETAPGELRARIERRARAWLAQGWVGHVRALVLAGYGGTRPMGSVGFRDISDALAQGAVEPEALAAGAIDEELLATKIVQHTCTFARRQRTWLSHEPVAWVRRPEG